MRVLGHHPETGEEITVRRGPYGLYVQQGEAEPTSRSRSRDAHRCRAAWTARRSRLEQAIGLLSLPRLVGMHPETQEPIEAGIGRFGPYVKMGAVFGSLDRDDDVLAVGLNRAVDRAGQEAGQRAHARAAPEGRRAGASVRKGRFGPYVQHGKTVANLPRGVAMDDMTLDQAVALLAEKGKPLRPKGAKKGGKKAEARTNGANGRRATSPAATGRARQGAEAEGRREVRSRQAHVQESR